MMALTKQQRAALREQNAALGEAISLQHANGEVLAERVMQAEANIAELVAALELMLERIAEPPEANCSCHISPPCNDCVDFSGEREAFEFAKDVLASVKGGAA